MAVSTLAALIADADEPRLRVATGGQQALLGAQRVPEDLAENPSDVERVETGLPTKFRDLGEHILLAADVAQGRPPRGLDLSYFENKLVARGEGIDESRIGRAQTGTD